MLAKTRLGKQARVSGADCVSNACVFRVHRKRSTFGKFYLWNTYSYFDRTDVS